MNYEYVTQEERDEIKRLFMRDLEIAAYKEELRAQADPLNAEQQLRFQQVEAAVTRAKESVTMPVREAVAEPVEEIRR